jgi:hypothetical protein
MHTGKQINGALVLLLLCICIDAQTAAPLETGKFPLVLAVVYNPGLPPEYQLLPDGSGVWYSRFARIKNWQQAPGSLVVDAVYVTSTMEGEAVTVRVAVLYGKSHDAGTLVGTYAARENEKIVVSALTRFGIEPFEITLVRTAPVVPSPPKLENKTKALDIISVQPEGLSLPSYKLTLRNVSTKNISALMINVFEDASFAGGAFLQGEEGQPLIASGNLYTAVNLLLTKPQITVAGNAPPSGSGTVLIVVTTAIFDDGAYEGEVNPALMFQTFVLGRKTVFKKLVPLLDRQIADVDNDQPEAILQFKEKLLALRYEIDDNDVKELLGRFPNGAARKRSAESTIQILQRQLLADLNSYAATPAAQRPGFKSWLISTRQKYAAWLGRI